MHHQSTQAVTEWYFAAVLAILDYECYDCKSVPYYLFHLVVVWILQFLPERSRYHCLAGLKNAQSFPVRLAYV